MTGFKKKKKDSAQSSVFCDSWQTVWDSLCVCVYWVRWVKKDESAVWSSQRSTFPIVTEASDTNACIGCCQNIGTDCAELSCFVAMQPDKQAALLWCVHLPDRSGPVKPSRPLQLVCACFCHVAVLHLAVTQLQSHFAFTGKVLKDWWAAKVWHGQESGQGTANGTSRHIQTRPVWSWLNRSSSDIVHSSNFSS